ncbi:12709_t:CDS:2 [Cetraspora pellucida]|uniref:12709_t:CDS:1 n=1 Tax=Cetraspora pellucida TaxID=1433469 RepID=A0A9N9EJQ0_9GLOM|nr:12709_t:CDS:2 [Cetraspora pellucida]
MDYKNNSEYFEKRLLNIAVLDQHLAKALDTPIVKQMFGTWKRIGLIYFSLYEITEFFHNNHLIENKTNKFASKYKAFSENMLKDIKF